MPPGLLHLLLTAPPLPQSTTLILWVPLIVTCIIQLVFSARCSAACATFLGLPCCPNRRRGKHYNTSVRTVSL